MGFFLRERMVDHIEASTVLTESTFTEWLGYFFKGYSKDEIDGFEKVLNSLKTKKDAIELSVEIDAAIDKVKSDGDNSHTIGNWVMLIGTGAIVLLIKHLIKVGFRFNSKTDVIKQLRKLKIAVEQKRKTFK